MGIDEHFVPTQGLDLDVYLAADNRDAVHHLIRYAWALQVLADRPSLSSVLDVACGAGYGSYQIAQTFPQTRVIGADYDCSAIELAQRTYVLPNLTYLCGDVLRWAETLGAAMYDAIISFDTIEHVPHREVMLQNVIEHLHPSGALLLSTPCGLDYTVLRPTWEHHWIEYSSGRLYDFLRRYFQTVLRPDDKSLPHLAVFDQLQGSAITYVLRMNPVLCIDPLVIANPYREVPAPFESRPTLQTTTIAHKVVSSVGKVMRRLRR
jgi:SAM-dependent methyltransferase